MNALLGVAKPGDMGADVLQFNLHKTFSTPHGGGGPGAGPVGVRRASRRICRRRAWCATATGCAGARTSRAPIGRVRTFHGNFGMLVRAYATCARSAATASTRGDRDGGAERQLHARAARRTSSARRTRRRRMHECVFTDATLEPHGVKTLDVAKRLLDYGFYAPTIYFPLVVPGALMIEPTETESKETLDEFIAAMEAIAAEARETTRTRCRRAARAPSSAASTRRAPPAARCCAGRSPETSTRGVERQLSALGSQADAQSALDPTRRPPWPGANVRSCAWNTNS